MTQSGLMKEYAALQRQHPGAVVLWRIGDFDEAYGVDASEIAAALQFTLTTRKTGDDVYPMCGYPVYLREKYWAELRRQNIRFVVYERHRDGLIRRV
jgi:DNA mismatch repair protein MutS